MAGWVTPIPVLMPVHATTPMHAPYAKVVGEKKYIDTRLDLETRIAEWNLFGDDPNPRACDE